MFFKKSNPNPVVTIEMEDGSIIEAELYPKHAPNTVNNFISLVKSGFYDGLTFHRVVKNFVIQGGSPDGGGISGPGYTIAGEYRTNGFTKNRLMHSDGVLSMARTADPNSAGSQFFIVHRASYQLDGNYAAFGRVKKGLDVVRRMGEVKTGRMDRPEEELRMKKVTVETFGVEYPEPVKYSEDVEY